MPRIDPDKVKLLHGPYSPPRLLPGDRVNCLYRDRLMVVTSWSSARISWPWVRPVDSKGRPGLLVDEELARAVRIESALAVRHWWGASQHAVWCWRKALGVPRFNEGSARLQRLNSEAGAEATRGVALEAEQVEERRRRAVELELVKYMQPCPRPGGSRPWTEEELALLGTMPDAELAMHIKRTRNAVRIERERRCIPPPAGQQAHEPTSSRGKPWTKADDRVVMSLVAVEAARRLGRSVQAVYNRRRQIKQARP